MLLRKTQGTQLDAVYEAFFERYADVIALSRADVTEVRRLLKPLGLTSRADHLKMAATTIVDRFNGHVPPVRHDLETLLGVGRYVSACVASHSFGLKEPPVDTNVERVLSRVFSLTYRGGGRPDPEIEEAYRMMMPDESSGMRELHYAIMDLASSICRPRTPNCTECPLSTTCRYAIVRGLS